MSPPVLEALGVSKILGSGPAQVRALKDIDLALHGGELTMLMGPSGSGKTTLLSVLGLMLAPTAGHVRVAGVSTEGAAPETLAALRRQHVGYIFQSYHLFPTLTASENVQLALDVRGEHGEPARERAHAALARVGLSHKLDSFPRELSGGEQQRVAIARAIVSDPSYVLADEPTAALDGKNGQAILSILADIAKDPGRGVLVVTHDSRLTAFADRTIDIEDGRLVREQRNNVTAEAVPVALDGG
jgi:putative ABC transport system ATP-binding protein